MFRTPSAAFLPLLDYEPSWFTGSGFDPSAGDGRMLAEITARGSTALHHANDIREEEVAIIRERLPGATITVGDYLAMPRPAPADFWISNAPFSLAEAFVRHAQTHVKGPICVLQSVAWQGTARRSRWLRNAGLAHVLNLARRPKWEVDVGTVQASIWDYAWFVFLPGHQARPQMDWLFDAGMHS